MVNTGDWIAPRLNGVKYFEKPPLFYWVQAAQLTFFGLGEFSGRFWTAMTMLAICLVTSVVAYKRYGQIGRRLIGAYSCQLHIGFFLQPSCIVGCARLACS